LAVQATAGIGGHLPQGWTNMGDAGVGRAATRPRCRRPIWCRPWALNLSRPR